MPIGNRFDAVRVAEEYSILDVISRGRVEMGFVKGAPFEVTPANSNPADLMARFWEAHDLILKAMTTHDGPTDELRIEALERRRQLELDDGDKPAAANTKALIAAYEARS